MSGRSRRGPPAIGSGKDPGGRLLLGVGAVALIVIGLTRDNQFAGFPLVLVGVLLLILFAFYSRISGALGFGKFQVPIIQPHHEEEPEQTRRAPSSTQPQKSHRASLREVSDAARNPTTTRNRSR